MKEQILTLVSLVSTAILPVAPAMESFVTPLAETRILAKQTLDLTIREPNPYANQVFADNILLSLHYLKGDVDNPRINWEKIREPFEVSFTLKPGEVFSFHANVLPEFNPPVFDPEGLRPEWAGGPAVTMNSRFYMEEGYKSVAGLGGNGVCHLASLINWVASEAGLKVTAKVKHDFFPVPGVPREYGTSILSQSQDQNLYIQNTFDSPVKFTFKVMATSVDLILSR